MTETTQSETTTNRTENAIATRYAEEKKEQIRGEGTKIHSVAEALEDGSVITRCGHHFGPHQTKISTKRPPHLSGNNICYRCVRAGPQEPSQ